ncbi:MAG: amidohydrolase family protein [Clostridiales bacterium]|nr:amidohydrolase family protein [Clostridiales bacterium]
MGLFQVTDYDRQVYERELKDFLPDEMIDIHTHVWLEKLRPRRPLEPGEVKRTVTWPSLVAKDNSIEDLQETYRLMFPGKRVTPMIFASAGRENLDAGNAYIRECSERAGVPALYYSHPNQGAEELEQNIREGGFLGVKSYLDLSPAYLPEAEIRIFDFFPHHQLKMLDGIGGIVMLHIPRHMRLRDPVNLAQILEIKQKYPKLRLIIAHIGRAYTESDVGNAFEVLAPCTDLMFDFCANTCEFAMTKLLEAVGASRVLFGSDMPILRMRMRRIEENNTYINLIPPGLYGDPKQDSHLREVSPEEAERLTFFMYEEILAFKRAAKAVGLDKQDIGRAFFLNAKELIDGARRDIHG